MVPKRLTVALLTYNRTHYLKESLEAILGQTFADFELLVLDNHSSDGTPELVMSYKDRRIIYVRQPEGVNPAENHVTGEWFARGDLFIVTHDDDVMEPTMLERQLEAFRANPRLLACATNASLIDEQGRLIQDRLYALEADRHFTRGDYIRAYLEEKLWLPASTYMIRRRVIYPSASSGKKPMALMRAKYPANNDILGMMQLNVLGPICLLAEPLMRYRQHQGQECKNMDQSAPLLATFNEMVRLETRNRHYSPYKAPIHAFRARYKAQHLLLRNPLARHRARLLRELKALKEEWSQAIPQSRRIQDAAFPLEILLHLLDLGSTLAPEQIRDLESTHLQDGPTRGYRHWLQALGLGGNLLSARPGFRRIAVLGSLLAAHLIVLDALKRGIQVVCCLDSSPARQGKEIYGIPIEPHSALKPIEHDLDAVVLSNEIDNTDAMKRILATHLNRSDLPILSWKDLAQESNTLACRPARAKRT